MRVKAGFIVKIAIACLFLFLTVIIVDKTIELNRLKEEEKKREQLIQNYTLIVERLNSQYSKPVSEETIKSIAKEKLNLRDPGERIYANNVPN